MSISGNLRTMELSELLQWVSQGEKTGMLVLESGEVEKKIYFEKGRIVASSSSKSSEQLGHFLVSHGHITEPELSKAIAMQGETGMLLGKILVTIGGISESDLRELLVLQTEESVYDLFSWKEGAFHFVDGERLERGMIPIALDVTALTLQGMNRLDEWNRIRKLLPNDQSVPVLVRELDDEELSRRDRRILGFVDDDRSIQEICTAAHSSEFFVSRVMVSAVEKGWVKLVLPRETGEFMAVGPSTPPSGSGSMRAVDAETLIEMAHGHLAGGELTRALRHLRAARSLEPDNKPVLKRLDAAEDEIRRRLRADGLDLEGVPILERTVEELTELRLSPEEGFLLTRIDGTSSIGNLLKISPLDNLDAQLVFFKLMKEGHIRLETAPS